MQSIRNNSLVLCKLSFPRRRRQNIKEISALCNNKTNANLKLSNGGSTRNYSHANTRQWCDDRRFGLSFSKRLPAQSVARILNVQNLWITSQAFSQYCEFSSSCNRRPYTKMAPILAPKVKLNNGYEMPVLGLGTYESKNNEGEIAVKHAIDVGYRHIDTAYFYQNEAEIGKAIKDKIAEGVVKREDIFLVTKLWNIHHEPERVEGACRKQLQLLGLDYIDLYLMHLPVGYKYVSEEALLPKDENDTLQLSDVDYVDTYKAMEKLVKLGLVRSIGVSNFNSQQLQRILDNCEIKPVTNQVECSPALNQRKLTQFCKERDITVTAYCPLGRPKPEEKKPEFYYSVKTQALAEKYKKTPAQIVLRYLVDIGVIPIPKSSNAKRIEENFNIFDFQLTPEEIAIMDGFNTGERLVPFNLIKGQNHKYWPFNIEF